MTAILQFWGIFRGQFLLALEYRAAMLIWMFSMVLPVVMMAGWLSVAESGPVGRFDRTAIVTYYAAAIVVRNLTGVWIIWELDADIRLGQMSHKLLRPVSPMAHYMASSLAPKPLRFVVLLPLLGAIHLAYAPLNFDLSPASLAGFAVSVAGAWLMMFFQLYTIGLLGFWITQATSLHDVWFGVFSLASGYLVPLDLFPPIIRSVLEVLPFRYVLSFPVEILTGRLMPGEIVTGLAAQAVWTAAFWVLYRFVWFRGLRRFSAVGA